MKEVKLFNLLKNISKKELINLKYFIDSPLFNNNKSLILLYNFIISNYDQVMKGELTNTYIFSNIFLNEIYNEEKYWKVTSSFALLIDKYFIFEIYQKDKYYQKNMLLEVYRKRNMEKQFSTLSKDIQKKFDTDINKGLNFFLNQTHFHFQNISYLGGGDNHNLEHDTEKLFENLKMFFIMTNITSVSIISNFRVEFTDNSIKNLWLFKDTIDYLSKNRSYIKKNYLTVYVFFLIILSKIKFNEEEHYFEAKKIILENTGIFSKNLLRHMYLNILNYSVSKFVKGDEKFLKEIFAINKIMDDNSLTLFGEYIHENYFYSVIEHSTMLGQTIWAEDFLNKYKHYLSLESGVSAVNLASARVNFENKNYAASLKFLLNVDNINPYYYLSHKILLVQNDYELKDFSSIPFILESLSKYLNRRIDISDEQKNSYAKFLLYFRKLKTIATTKVYLAKNLEKEILNEKYFLYKKWLLGKIKELK